MQSRFASIAKNGNVVIEEENVGAPAAGEVLLKAEFSTLSPGTERSLMAGDILPLPQRIGYSMAARVVDIGDDVDDIEVGDAVVTTGQHADYLVMDRRNITPVPDGVELEQAAFFNLAHTALYAIRRSALMLGEPAWVLGQGLVGALTAILAAKAGALPLIVTDLRQERLNTARLLGAHYAIDSGRNPDALEAIHDELGGIPVIFEATGSRKPLERAVALVGERGRIVMMSAVHGDAEPAVVNALMEKGASLVGGYVNSKPFSLARTDLGFGNTWPPAIAGPATRYDNADSRSSDDDIRTFLDMLRFGSIDLEPLITHRFGVDDIPGAYELVRESDLSLVGGVIDWR